MWKTQSTVTCDSIDEMLSNLQKICLNLTFFQNFNLIWFVWKWWIIQSTGFFQKWKYPLKMTLSLSNQHYIRFPRWSIFKFMVRMLRYHIFRMEGIELMVFFLINNSPRHTVYCNLELCIRRERICGLWTASISFHVWYLLSLPVFDGDCLFFILHSSAELIFDSFYYHINNTLRTF